MRHAHILMASLLLIAVPAAAQFEGMYESRNVTSGATGGHERFVMTVWLKGTRARIVTVPEGEEAGTTIIYRADRRVVWMLAEAERAYVEIPLGGGESPRPRNGVAAKVQKTGRTAKVAGYLCRQVVITRNGERTELWGTEKLRRLSKALEGALGADSAPASGSPGEEMDRLGLFPLKSTTTIEGQVVESQEVLRVVEGKVDDDRFEIPPGYVKRDMNELLERQSRKPE
jgi:hypothetical protein